MIDLGAEAAETALEQVDEVVAALAETLVPTRHDVFQSAAGNVRISPFEPPKLWLKHIQRGAWPIPRETSSGPLTRRYQVADHRFPPGKQTLSRADVAHFLLDELIRGAHVRQIVGQAG